MRLLKFTLILFASISIYAEPVQIDMHGGKDIKMPSPFSMQKPKSMHDMLDPKVEQKDTNQTTKAK